MGKIHQNTIEAGDGSRSGTTVKIKVVSEVGNKKVHVVWRLGNLAEGITPFDEAVHRAVVLESC
jgi:hypothetical protein